MTPIRNILVAAAALAALTAAGQANATSLAVKMACAKDYYAHCSQHKVGTPGVRKCMRAVGAGLSRGCINALVAAGEVSKSVVEKRLAAN